MPLTRRGALGLGAKASAVALLGAGTLGGARALAAAGPPVELGPATLLQRQDAGPSLPIPNLPIPVLDPTGVVSQYSASAPAGLPKPLGANALSRRGLSQLQGAIDWARRENRLVTIGEWSWPSDPDPSTTQWNDVAEDWMRLADQAGMAWDTWGESSYWGGDRSGWMGSYSPAHYRNADYDWARRNGPGSVALPKPSAALFERHLGTVPGRVIGASLVGLCITYLQDRSTFSNANPGVAPRDYFAESPDTVDYLVSRGIRRFRIPFKWERVQPQIGGPFNATELGRVLDLVDHIRARGCTAILNVQNFGAYEQAGPGGVVTKHFIDGSSGVLKTAHLVDFWVRMSNAVGLRDGIIYEIMNEPMGEATPAVVERFSQAVVTALRAKLDLRMILIPFNPYDNVVAGLQNHPHAWIQDPAGTRAHVYTLHHYMDNDRSGEYKLSYADELRAATQQGY